MYAFKSTNNKTNQKHAEPGRAYTESEIQAEWLDLVRSCFFSRSKVPMAQPVPTARYFSESSITAAQAMPSGAGESSTDGTRTEVAQADVIVRSTLEQQVRHVAEYSIKDFLSRPTIIDDGTIAIASTPRLTWNIWDLWSKNAAVRSKLKNYAFFRGTLCVRISLTSTAYNYGQLVVSYQPYNQFNAVLKQYDILDALSSTHRYGRVCYLTHSPYSHIIDVRDNTPVVLKIPFISPKNYFRVVAQGDAPYAAADSLVDFAAAGALYLYGINPVQSASSDFNSAVGYNIQAWAEDVELTTPTGTKMVISESKRFKVNKRGLSEYEDPPTVSAMSSAVANAAGALSAIPFIAPFTRPVEAFANGVSKIASIFGWSKPILLSEPDFVKPLVYSNGATTVGVDLAQKLAVDPKNSLVFNPVGQKTSADELCIQEIARRVTLINTFEWLPTDTPMTTTLWYSSVNPNLGEFTGDRVLLPWSVQPSALQFAALPFQFWRGDIKFTFKIACSQFHRGKFCICYEPNCNQFGTIMAGAMNINTQACAIIDIQETQEVEFTVEWNSDKEWLHTTNRPANYSDANDKTPSDPVFKSCLGFIRIMPINELISTGPTVPVYINVFVSCDNLQVALPDVTRIGSNLYLSESSISVKANSITDKCTDRWMGESIPSFRGLLKRFTQEVYAFGSRVAGDTSFTCSFNHFPQAASGPTQTGTGNARNIYSYLRYAYLAMSGSYRHRLKATSTDTLFVLDNFTAVTRNDFDYNGNQSNFIASSSTAGNGGGATAYSGSVIFNPYTNAGVEVDCAWYNNNQFLISFSESLGYEDATLSTFMDGEYMDMGRCDYVWSATTTPSDGTSILFDMDAGAGEDFNFSCYMGAPPRWFSAQPS